MESLIKNPQVYVVLLNWNGWRDTVECIRSLEGLSYDNFRVVVVDNNSTDESVAQIRTAFPRVTIIEAEKNLGFAGGCNLGTNHALGEGAEYVWLLNNDTKVDSGALQAMVERAEGDHTIGAVGSAIYSMTEPQRLQAWGGGYVNFILGHSRHFHVPVAERKLQFITGASLLLGRRALEKLGLLDRGFFMYWEDADYCFRLRRAGWRLAVAGDARIWHKEQGTIGKKSALLDLYFNRSAARFFRKNAAIPFVSIGVGITLRTVKRALIGDWERARAVWAGIGETETSI